MPEIEHSSCFSEAFTPHDPTALSAPPMPRLFEKTAQNHFLPQTMLTLKLAEVMGMDGGICLGNREKLTEISLVGCHFSSFNSKCRRNQAAVEDYLYLHSRGISTTNALGKIFKP
ncbi:MAG: hypothetical protein VKI81_04730 [Synechococcaceae cyanobacterium]|nr:hypothetical protein [Synechococcaceae cyanobacterium]